MRQLRRDMMAAAHSHRAVAYDPPLIRRDEVAASELGMKTGQGFLPRTEETADASRTWLADHPIAALTDEKAPPDTATMT